MMFLQLSRVLPIVCLVIASHLATGFSAEPRSESERVSVFCGEPRLLLVNGYSTSFHWWAFLQRKIDRYLDYEGGPEGRVVEVQAVTKGGTPISLWMDPDSGERSAAWKERLTPAMAREKGNRAVVVLAQQSLQFTFPEGRGEGIRNKDDLERIKRGADVIGRYACNLLEDGAAEVVIAMHIYKRGMEPEIGHERLALAELMRRKPAGVFAGPDVWEPTSKQFPLAFDRDRAHPNYIGAEMMAHYWFASLLEREGLEVPEWSREEMDDAIEKRPMGITREPQVFMEKLTEWRIVNRRLAVGGMTDRDRSRPVGRGARGGVPSGILRRYDTDGDGRLNAKERATFEKAREERNRAGAGKVPRSSGADFGEAGYATMAERLRRYEAFPAEKPAPGDVAPTFELSDLQGRTVSLWELLKTKPVLLETGSYTCPVFRGQHGSVERLYGEFADRVHLVVLYGKEEHPGSVRHPEVRQPTRKEERVRLARRIAKELSIEVPVLVDEVDNEVSEAYGGLPNCGYLIGQDGRVFHKLSWMHPKLMREPLEAILGMGGRGGAAPSAFPVGGSHPARSGEAVTE